MVNAPSTPGMYVLDPGNVWVAVTPYEVVGGQLGGALTPSYDLVAPNAPTAPYGLALASKTDTTISVTWQEDPDSTVGSHRVYVGGVKYGADLAAGARNVTISGLTQSTQYKITVTRLNSTGQESPPSNTLTVTTNATQAGVPTAPTGLTQTSLADTSWAGSWSETTDASVLRHWQYLNGVRYGASLSASATSATWSGLTAGTNYTAYVTRENATGESAPSNTLAFKTTGGGGVKHNIVMGVSNSDEDHEFNFLAMRCYDYATAQSLVNGGARVLGLTNSGTSLSAGPAAGTELDSFLTGFYGWTDAGGVSKNAGVELHIGLGNEVDKNWTTGALPSTYIASVKAMSDVVHSLDSKGNRRFPKASMGVDMTQNHIRNYGSGPRFKAIAPYLDFMACSMYPPGRKSQPTRWDDYSLYCGDGTSTDEPLGVVIDWHQTYPNCAMFETWEIGAPIDHPTTWGTNPGGEPTAQTDFTIRPRYFTGGVDSSGKNWKGFLQYCYDILDAAGVAMGPQLYWDQQTKNPYGPPNQFWHDRSTSTSTRANPDLASAWFNWVPGKVLPHG